MSATPSKRRRIPRRRLHALRLDTALVLLLCAALFAAFPSGAAFRASHPRAVPPPAIDLRLEPPEPSGLRDSEPPDLFSPEVFPFGADGFLPSGGDVPEPDAAVAARRVPPVPGRAASAESFEGVPLPESALTARLGPSPRPFSEPRPAAAAPAPAAAPRSKGTMTLFYDPGVALPTVVVDAPGLAASEIPAIEAAAFARRDPPAETSRVVRLPIP